MKLAKAASCLAADATIYLGWSVWGNERVNKFKGRVLDDLESQTQMKEGRHRYCPEMKQHGEP